MYDGVFPSVAYYKDMSKKGQIERIPFGIKKNIWTNTGNKKSRYGNGSGQKGSFDKKLWYKLNDRKYH